MHTAAHITATVKKKFKFGVTERLIERFRKNRARRLSHMLGQNPVVLDIGCGNGNFLKHLKDLTGAEAHGIERDSMSAERASGEGLQIHVGMDQLKLFSDGRFDAVTLFHVFEHLENPVSHISEIRRILKPGGILVMSFPDIGSWQAGWFRAAWLHLDPPRHLFFVHRGMFRRYMSGIGFRTISEKGFSPEQNPYGAVQSVLNSVCRKRDVLFERLKGNDRYAPEYGKYRVVMQKVFFITVFPFFIITDLMAAFFRKSATVTLTFIRESS